MDARSVTGKRAEDLVAELLVRRGFEIVGRNARVGRLELDVIARRGPLLLVCEVRSRTGARFHPAETIDPRKVARIRRATAQWLRDNRPGTSAVRFDAAAVILEPDGTAKVDYYEDAF